MSDPVFTNDDLYEELHIPRWNSKDKDGNPWYINKRYDEIEKNRYNMNKTIMALSIHKQYREKIENEENEIKWLRFIVCITILVIICLFCALL